MADDTEIESEKLNIEIQRLRVELADANEKLSTAYATIQRVENLYTTARLISTELKQKLDDVNQELKKCKCGSINFPAADFTIEKVDVAIQCDGDFSSTDNSDLQLNINQNWSETVNENGEIQSIADSVREVAEQASSQSEFVYDAATKLYYDSHSGYYYDAEASLYYDPQNGAYYYLDGESQTLQFHSYIEDKIKFKTLYHIIYSRAAQDVPHTSDSKRKGRLKEDSCQYRRSKRRKPDAKDETAVLKIYKVDNTEQSHHALDEVSQKASGIASKIEEEKCKKSIDKHRLLDCDTELTEVLSSDESSECSELEEGELSSTSDEESQDFDDSSVGVKKSAENIPLSELIQGPPCIRVIVKSSDCLPVGKLYILTCDGATIGRQADMNHAIVIPSSDVSKLHCEIQFCSERQRYVIKDYASESGTFVNGSRLSESKTLSSHRPLYHGDVLRIGASDLDLHIHPRSNTCSGCEPGVIASTLAAEKQKEQSPSITDHAVILSKEEKEKERRRQLKTIKKKYGLKDMGYEMNPVVKDSGRRDRAAERRIEHGSSGPHERDELPASVHRAINTDNKGHKLLSKLGWKEGESLGKSQSGITEPIMASVRLNPSAGLGSGVSCEISADDVQNSDKMKRWLKAQQRYSKTDRNIETNTSSETSKETKESTETQ